MGSKLGSNYKSCRVRSWSDSILDPHSPQLTELSDGWFVVRMRFDTNHAKERTSCPWRTLLLHVVEVFSLMIEHYCSFLVSCIQSCYNHATALKFQILSPFLRDFMVRLRRGKEMYLRRWTVSPKIRSLLSTDHFSLSVSLSNSSTTSLISLNDWFVNMGILEVGEHRLCTVEHRWHL